MPQLPSHCEGDAVTQPCFKCCRNPIKCHFGKKQRGKSTCSRVIGRHQLGSAWWESAGQHPLAPEQVWMDLGADVLPLWFLILCPRAGFLGEAATCPSSAHPCLQDSFPSPPFCHCPSAGTFIPAQESPGHFPHPIPCMALHHLHPHHRLLLSELCPADPSPPKAESQPALPGPPVSPPLAPKNPMRSYHCWQEHFLTGQPQKILLSSCHGSGSVLEGADFRVSSLGQPDPAAAPVP